MKALNILKVIHGFPPDYMAGSEVYSYTFCKELLRKGFKVNVFTRIENEFDAPYTTYRENIDGIDVLRINKPKDYNYKDKFYDKSIDEIFEAYLLEIQPDIIHFGHVCHLSVNLIKIAKKHNKKIVYTLHDFWLSCVKGQLINKENKICSGPSVEKCAACSPYCTNIYEVKNILDDMKEIRDLVDLYISPSNTVKNFFINQGIPKDKIIYQHYGFNYNNIKYRKRFYTKNSNITFAFLGRIVPTKGIKVLCDAFTELPYLDIYIYGNIGGSKRFLEKDNIHFMGGYHNNDIKNILDKIDVLIVPSTWLENSPLVMQEAFLAGVTVIASNIGGMKELIGENEGFLFEANNYKALKSTIENITSNPEILNSIKDNRHKVLSIEDDAKFTIMHYQKLLNLPRLKRITIDTNPDTCNYKCKMCDTHSIYNKNFKHTRKDMDKELLYKCLEEAKNNNVYEIIPTTMGEPTLYKYFDNIVEFCLHNNIKLNLTTNGSLLFSQKYPESYIKEKLLPVISDIKISFNSLDKHINEEIMQNSNTEQIINTIQKLCRMRNEYVPNASITIQMTFMRSNIDSIMPMIKTAIDWGVNRIKGHQLWITHKELESEALYNDPYYIEKWNKLINQLHIYQNKIKLENFSPIKSFEKVEGDCPFLTNELWINYKGDISVCCAPDYERKKLGNFGNIKINTLYEVLTSEKYIDLCTNYKQNNICKQCIMRR